MADLTKTCPECDGNFTTRRSVAIYCSRRCMGEYGRRRRAELRLAGQGKLRKPVFYAVDGMKKCRDCSEIKSVDDFPARAASLDGCRPYCKACKKIRHSGWLEANREAVTTQRRAFYAENRDRLIEERRADYPEQRSSAAAAKRDSYVENPDKFRNRSHQWRLAHPGENYQYVKTWRDANPEKARLHQHLRRARRAGTLHIPYTAEQLSQRWEMFGNRCYVCSEPAEATDHVKPLACGGAEMLANLRPICHRCNSAKRGDWLGIELYHELISWVRSNQGPLRADYRKIARAIRENPWLQDVKQPQQTQRPPSA